MPDLNPDQYALVQPLFEPFDFHLCARSVLAGTAPGQVWVDDPAQPRVAFVSGSEGSYLGGDPACLGADAPRVFAGLRQVIPHFAYLMVDPPDWESQLGQAWTNIAARRHHRQHYLLRPTAAAEWRKNLIAGIRVVPVDAAFFEMDHLENHSTVMDWVSGWHSRDHFLQHGAGTCLVHGNTIATWCMMDCFLGDRCEIGIVTDMRYRRRGLGSLVVSATIETCLARGYREIGWQCLSSNAGSIGVARRNGFVLERDYAAYSSSLPTESAGDMTREAYEDWARHYERCRDQEPGWAFLAAQAWALAGRPAGALSNLRILELNGWKCPRSWFEHSWPFDSLRPLPAFQKFQAILTEGE